MPDPVGPENQHRDVGLRRGANPLEDGHHLLVAADHFAEALDRWRGLFDTDGRASLEELVEQPRHRILTGSHRDVFGRFASLASDDAEFNQLAHAVLDVESHASERLHQRFDVERLVGSCGEKAQDARAQRRLHQGAESPVEIVWS